MIHVPNLGVFEKQCLVTGLFISLSAFLFMSFAASSAASSHSTGTSELCIDARRYLFDNAYPKENGMDWNRVEGNWKETKGKIKEKWGQLTDDDLAQVNGQRDQLEGKIQQRYGVAKDMVRKDVDAWLKSQP
jgi:uncharacterized protein YjbJ (UPF0337 family)